MPTMVLLDLRKVLDSNQIGCGKEDNSMVRLEYKPTHNAIGCRWFDPTTQVHIINYPKKFWIAPDTGIIHGPPPQ